MPPEIGDEYVIISGGKAIVCRIVNSSEDTKDPGLWHITVQEPETKTLWWRTRRVVRTPKLVTGGNN